MALPKWITPAGNLGIVPELEYWEFPIEAYDPSAGNLVYTLVSGKLPLGLQVVNDGTVKISPSYPHPHLIGKIQGVPVSEQGPDQNVAYTFTIRVKNDETGGLTDRTFTLTITNVAPPVINVPPRNSYLGLVLDGTKVSIQLEAIEFLPESELYWSLKSGDLPPGLTLTSTGLLSGYVEPIPSIDPDTVVGWDATVWNTNGWDFPLQAISKSFTFTIEVFDGSNYDLSTYRLKVYPTSSLTADNDELEVDTTVILSSISHTKHDPIIITTQNDLPSVREGSYFSFQVQAIDLDGDLIRYTVPSLSNGAFDEQDLSLTTSYPYVAAVPRSNQLYVGIYPHATSVYQFGGTEISSVLDYTQGEFMPGDQIKVLSQPFLVQGQLTNSWEMATITSEVTVRLTGNTIPTTAAVGRWLTQESSGANATISNVSLTTGTINLIGSSATGTITVLLPTYQITFSGNIYANIGDYITQVTTSGNANARVTSTVSGGKNIANVIYISNAFINGTPTVTSGNIQIRGLAVGVWPTANVKDNNNITISANIGDIVTQNGYTGNAVVTATVRDSLSIPVAYNSAAFNSLNGNIKINGSDANVWITSFSRTTIPYAGTYITGQYITQGNANAKVIANVVSGNVIPVQFLGNTFTINGSNIKLGGSNVNAYPSRVACNTDITATYNDALTFNINSAESTGIPKINTVSVNANITALVSVGVSVGGASVEGTIGFDGSKFDQGALSLPLGLTLNQYSGWIIGQLPSQTISQIDYDFEIIAKKFDDDSYFDSRLYTLTVLGDLNNRIDWITDSDLGTIETGKISDLFIKASSPLGKTIFYEFASNYPTTSPWREDAADIYFQRLPQGLELSITGLIRGRVSFEVFSLDQGTTTFDPDIFGSGQATTTFDFTYKFTIRARDSAKTISSTRTFTLRLRQLDRIPYENLYLKALPNKEQRSAFEGLMSDRAIFPMDKIYREADPWFGIASDIKTLFLAGLSPSTLAEYAQAAQTNHFTKRLSFGDIKTAQVLDANFNVKYEVIYIEVRDENTNSSGQGPANVLDLSGNMNPYYDSNGNAYTTAYPNSFENMDSVISDAIGYQDKGVLPDWMTSRQVNGRQLGFVHAAVLAYTNPGESALIAYRLAQRNFDFNSIDFTVDRYQLDNIYTANYDITANAFITSEETTFDRYPRITGDITSIGTVEYAISEPFESINNHTVAEIKGLGGMDGIKNFKDGDTIVFARQEYLEPGTTVGEYNTGWSDSLVLWDEEGTVPWAYNSDTSDNDTLTPYDPTLTPQNPGPYDYTPGQLWDQSSYVPGYTENLLNPSVTNKRIGVWQININSSNVVKLTPKQLAASTAGSITGNVLTIGGTITATFRGELTEVQPDESTAIRRMMIYGDGIAPGTYIVEQLTSTEQDGQTLGKSGTYTVNISQTVATTTIYQDVKLNDSVYVRNGFSYGGTNIYFDRTVKAGNTVPNYSILTQKIRTTYTKFDLNGTRFFNNRDSFVVPEQGDKYIKFAKNGVFT